MHEDGTAFHQPPVNSWHVESSPADVLQEFISVPCSSYLSPESYYLPCWAWEDSKKVQEEKRNSHHYLTVCVPASKHILDRFQAYKQQRCLVVVVQSFTDKQVTTFNMKNISKCSQRCDISFGIFCTYLHSELFYGVMFTPDLSTVQ